MSTTTNLPATGRSSAAGAEQPTRRRVDPVAILMEGTAFIALIILIIAFASQTDVYLSGSNLVTMTRHVAWNAILALGMLLVILKGGIDLSIGSTVGLSGVVAAQLLKGVELSAFDTVLYPPVWVIIGVSLAVGVFVGWVNGTLITRCNVAPFIATLGSLYVVRGAALLISDGETVSILRGSEDLGNTGYRQIGGRIFTVPVAIIVMIVLAVTIAVLLRKTPFGRWLYATGGNERASDLAGVPVNMVKRRVYMISGFCAAIVGLIMSSELDSAPPRLGETFELNAIAAVVIGGASLSGGRGTVRGVLVGAFVIGFLSDGLVLVDVSTFWQMVVKGGVIVLAVILDQIQERVKRTRAAAAAANAAAHQGLATTTQPMKGTTPS